MTVGDKNSTAGPRPENQNSHEGEDLTGRNRMMRNVLSSWLGHLVFVIAGFVMPRLIDDRLGQVMLGIWDLCWSMVNYLALANLGMGSATNRYVAKFRAVNDVESLRSTVSSVMLIQLFIGLLVLTGAVVIAALMPKLFSETLGAKAGEASWVVGFLGASLALQLSMDAFRGVLTGCHRWDLHNSIQAGSYAITVTVMAGALLLGGGLGHLAIIYFLGTTVGEFMRAAAAYRVCPELRIGMKHASWGQGKRILRFGGNNVLIGTPPFLLVQTTNVLVAGTLGAAALAVFSRPISLMRHVETFLNKFSYVLTPMVGSLQSSGQESEIRELFLRSTRYGMAMALPILLVLAIFGDVVLHIWMGPDYAQTALIVVLAAGYCLPVTQVTGLRILVGLNRHGRVGQWSVAISLFALVIGGLTLNSVGWSMVGAALLVTLPLTITYGIISPLQACKELGIPLADYIRQVFKVPVLCGCALAACLFSARWLLPHNEIAALLAGSSAGFLALSVLYWRLLLTVDHKTRIGRFIPLLSGSNSRGG